MTENREKKGLFARLREGMTKTRESITHAIDQLTGVYKELDDDFYDDLEAVLIGADIGVKTTEEIIARLTAASPVVHEQKILMEERKNVEH